MGLSFIEPKFNILNRQNGAFKRQREWNMKGEREELEIELRNNDKEINEYREREREGYRGN